MVLFHRVLGNYSDAHTTEITKAITNIMEAGLVPKIADEYHMIVPSEVRELPIVWLGEKFKKPWIDPECILKIDTEYLEPERLYALNLDDVDWWVYQGTIPPNAIRRLVP